MDDPAKWDWRGKIETRASPLAGGLFFRRPIRPATAYKPLFIRAHPCHLTQSLPLFRPSGQPWVALSRTRPDARLWFIYSLRPRSACGLMQNLTARKSRHLLQATHVGTPHATWFSSVVSVSSVVKMFLGHRQPETAATMRMAISLPLLVRLVGFCA